MNLTLPTRRKEALPEGFDYPLWPSVITKALEETPQVADAELDFRVRDEFQVSRWLQRMSAGGVITLIKAEYRQPHSPYFPLWRITVNAVPREHLEEVREYLLTEGLPDLAGRLSSYALKPDESVCEVCTYDLAIAGSAEHSAVSGEPAPAF